MQFFPLLRSYAIVGLSVGLFLYRVYTEDSYSFMQAHTHTCRGYNLSRLWIPIHFRYNFSIHTTIIPCQIKDQQNFPLVFITGPFQKLPKAQFATCRIYFSLEARNLSFGRNISEVYVTLPMRYNVTLTSHVVVDALMIQNTVNIF